MLKAFSIVGAALLVAGCSATTSAPKQSAAAGPPPSGYRAAVLSSAKQTFFDPYSVRDAQISQPLYASAVFDGVTPIPRKGWIVCVSANAKNRMGAYTGIQPSVFLFQGETVVLTLSGPAYAGQLADHCRSAVYSPFAELDAASG